MEWEENVYFFRQEEPGHFDFEEENVSIYGLSYWHREIGEPVYDSIIPEDLSKINILLVHGGDPQHIPYHPKHILENGFDYIAAGHIHKGGQQIPGRAVMAGSLEPTDKNDVGSHGYWLGTIDKEHTDIHFHPVKKCEYCHEVYPVTGKTTNFELCEWAKTLLAERPGYQYFRLFLRGKVSPDTGFDTAKLEEFDRVVDVTEQLSPDYDYEKLKENYKDYIEDIMKENNLDAIIYPSSKNKILELGTTGIINLSAHASSTINYPSITIPIGYDSDNLPYSLEIMTKTQNDEFLLSLANIINSLRLYESKNPLSSLYEVDEEVTKLIQKYDKRYNKKNTLFNKKWLKKVKNYFKDYQNIEKPETEAKKLNQNYYVSLIITFIIQCIVAITILAILLLVRKHLKIQKKRRKRRK